MQTTTTTSSVDIGNGDGGARLRFEVVCMVVVRVIVVVSVVAIVVVVVSFIAVKCFRGGLIATSLLGLVCVDGFQLCSLYEGPTTGKGDSIPRRIDMMHSQQ